VSSAAAAATSVLKMEESPLKDDVLDVVGGDLVAVMSSARGGVE
jgi:hypothetical protein